MGVYVFMRDHCHCFPIRKDSNLSLFVSKCSGLCLDFPLSVKAVGVGRGHRLPHCDLRTSPVNTQ